MDTRRFRSPWLLCAAAYGCITPLLFAGCTTTPDRQSAFDFATPAARNTQLALTGLIALDTAQTVTIARSAECLYEANPIAAAVFGSEHPSTQRVLVTNAVYLTGHWLLGAYLDRKARQPVDLSITAQQDVSRKSRWRVMQRVYQALSFIGHGAAVINNQARGIRPFSTFDCMQ
jgi:hypothetical protein